ncbi:MAG: hypothetical protein AB7G39_04425 [Alphaproteobacteria bacterium]
MNRLKHLSPLPTAVRWLALACALLIAAGGLPALPRAMFGGEGGSWIEIGGQPTTVPGSRAGAIQAPAKSKLRVVIGSPDQMPAMCPFSDGSLFLDSFAGGWRLPADSLARFRKLHLRPDATGPPVLPA